jgi:multicomponent Na+:H+ antiporter subunit F
VLALVICIFSAGIFLFVRARLYGTLDDQIRADLATIEKVYQEETGDLGELAHRMGITLFQVAEGETILYQTPDWPPGGTTPYRLGTRGDPSHRIVAARDETALRQSLWTLGVILAMLALGLVRILRGPGEADRMMAAQLIGTGGIAALLLLGAVTGVPSAVDVALTVALLATFASIAFVKKGSAILGESPEPKEGG